MDSASVSAGDLPRVPNTEQPMLGCVARLSSSQLCQSQPYWLDASNMELGWLLQYFSIQMHQNLFGKPENRSIFNTSNNTNSTNNSSNSPWANNASSNSSQIPQLGSYRVKDYIQDKCPTNPLKSAWSMNLFPASIHAHRELVNISVLEMRIEDYYLIRTGKLEPNHKNSVTNAISRGRFAEEIMKNVPQNPPPTANINSTNNMAGNTSTQNQGYNRNNIFNNTGNNSSNNSSNTNVFNNTGNNNNASSNNIFLSSSNNNNNSNSNNNNIFKQAQTNTGNAVNMFSNANSNSSNNSISNTANSSMGANNNQGIFGNVNNQNRNTGTNIFSPTTNNSGGASNTGLGTNIFAANANTNANSGNNVNQPKNIFLNNNMNNSTNNSMNNNTSNNMNSSTSNNLFANNSANNNNNIFNNNNNSNATNSATNNIFNNNNSSNSNNLFANNNASQNNNNKMNLNNMNTNNMSSMSNMNYMSTQGMTNSFGLMNNPMGSFNSFMPMMAPGMTNQAVLMPVPEKFYAEMLKTMTQFNQNSKPTARIPSEESFYSKYGCNQSYPFDSGFSSSRFGKRSWVDDEKKETRITLVIAPDQDDEYAYTSKSGRGIFKVEPEDFDIHSLRRADRNNGQSGDNIFRPQSSLQPNSLPEFPKASKKGYNGFNRQQVSRTVKFSDQEHQEAGTMKFNVFQIVSVDKKRPIQREVRILVDYPFTLDKLKDNIGREVVTAGLVKPNATIDISSYQLQGHPLQAVVYIHGKTINLPDQYYCETGTMVGGDVVGLKIGNQFGEVTWASPINVTNIEFSSAIKIQKDSLVLYESGKVPPVGTQLNSQCVFTLFTCSVANSLRKAGKWQPEYVAAKLRSILLKRGLQFLSYDPDNDHWKVKIKPN